MIFETLATESFGSPVRRAASTTLPGAAAKRAPRRTRSDAVVISCELVDELVESARDCNRVRGAPRSRPALPDKDLATDDGALVRPLAHANDGSRLVARLRDRADGGLSADEVLRLTRGDDD